MTPGIRATVLSNRRWNFARRERLQLATTGSGTRRLFLWLLVVFTSLEVCAQQLDWGEILLFRSSLRV